jgi:hypothetical protein
MRAIMGSVPYLPRGTAVSLETLRLVHEMIQRGGPASVWGTRTNGAGEATFQTAYAWACKECPDLKLVTTFVKAHPTALCVSNPEELIGYCVRKLVNC